MKHYFQKNKKIFGIILFFIITGLMILSFIFMKQKKTPLSFSQSVSIGTSSSVSTALLAIAESQHFFENQGIKVLIRLYPSAAVAFDEMLAGNIQVAGVAETPIVYKSFERNDFRVFATACTANNDPKIIARLSPDLKTPRDLAGKRIGSTKKGQSAHFFLDLFMLKHGISDKASEIIHDSPENIVNRLVSGEIDAASLFEPYAALAKEELKEKGILFEEPGLYFKTFNLVAKTEFLQDNPKAVQQIVKSLLRAEEFVMLHPDESIEIISRYYSVNPKIVRSYLSFSSFDITLSNALIMTLKDQAKWAIENHFTESSYIPDYLNFIYSNALEVVKPERMTIIK